MRGRSTREREHPNALSLAIEERDRYRNLLTRIQASYADGSAYIPDVSRAIEEEILEVLGDA